TDAAGLASLALEVDAAPLGPVLVPYFDGERTPPLPEATGSIVGLRPSTTRAELARAAHDGVLCGLLDGLDALRAAGVAADGEVLLVGGGARSAAFRRRGADLLGREVRVPDTDEVVATGAAVLGAAALDGADPAAIARAWDLGAGPVVEPDPAADPDTVRARYRAAAG
ncbi:MAG: FGGY-family carbohydrate kinase, partial [Actinomycetota bacterium]